MVRLVFAIVLLATAPASACIWDYDTLRDEQKGLPGVLEILSGRYEQRSAFFYSNRVQKMRVHLQTQPDDQAAIDNLAVALFRSNEPEKAIQMMREKEKRFPNQYTTASNLATFYMLSGDSASAVPLLQNAIKINPSAHFGREKYQLQLAQFLVDAGKQKEYPLADFLGHKPFNESRQASVMVDRTTRRVEPLMKFIHANVSKSASPSEEDAAAIEGILGMIRFGTENSPDLWYALGNLLLKKGDRHLAVRAYRRAIDAGHLRAAEVAMLLRSASSLILEGQAIMPTPEQMQIERQAGIAWSQQYMDYADSLIRSGKDADNETNYKAFYGNGGSASPLEPFSFKGFIADYARGAITFSLVATLLTAILMLSRKLIARR